MLHKMCTKGDNMSIKFQTIYNGYINLGTARFSVHPTHSEVIFRIGKCRFTNFELRRIMAMIEKHLEENNDVKSD